MLTTDLHEENKLYPETSTTFTERLERYNPSTGRVWKRYLLHCICSVTQSCLTLCNPMDYSPSGSSVHGIFQARILGVSCYVLLQGIFPTQGSNRGFDQTDQIHLLHWQVDSLPPASPGQSSGKVRALHLPFHISNSSFPKAG